MRGFDAGADLPQQQERALHRDRSFAPQQLIERFAFDVFHDQKEHPVVAFAKVGHVDNVRMLNRGCGARLALKAGDGFAFLQIFIREDIWPDRFHSHAPGQKIFIAGEIDLAHCAAAQTLFESITPIQQSRAGQSCLGVGLIVGTDERVVFKAAFTSWAFAHLSAINVN